MYFSFSSTSNFKTFSEESDLLKEKSSYDAVSDQITLSFSSSQQA